MCDVYMVFAHDWVDCLDFSDEKKVELFNTESYGGRCSRNNGFYHGKKWLNVTVTMWKEDVRCGNLFLRELYEDDKFPHWWLDSVFKERNNVRIQFYAATGAK